MPVYDYSCDACGVFAVHRPMAEYREPHDCPSCGVPAPRVLLTPPRLAGMESARRTAFQTNERAAHSPRQASAHTYMDPAAGARAARDASGGAKTFPGARPWMISHLRRGRGSLAGPGRRSGYVWPLARHPRMTAIDARISHVCYTGN